MVQKKNPKITYSLAKLNTAGLEAGGPNLTYKIPQIYADGLPCQEDGAEPFTLQLQAVHRPFPPECSVESMKG